MTSKPRHARGFTVVELLVVIGVIVLILSIALPGIAAAWRSAQRTRTSADMASIGTALEAYKHDFGDYPRVPVGDTGFAILGRALFGPGGVIGGSVNAYNSSAKAFSSSNAYRAGDCVNTGTWPANSPANEWVALEDVPVGSATPTNTSTSWVRFPYSDGTNGFGFRARAGGRSFKPYLQPEKFNIRGVAILDRWDNPILYFPARTRKPNITAFIELNVPSYVSPPTSPKPKLALYDGNDNLRFFLWPGELVTNPTHLQYAFNRMSCFMGDFTPGNIATSRNGIIDPGETALAQGPYILWSGGADTWFGPKIVDLLNNLPDNHTITKCDDVTNFR